jgi:malate/lactate dehydrogenase
MASEGSPRETYTAGIKIIGTKGATYYGIGTALVRTFGAILPDQSAVLTVSSLVPESMRLGQCLFHIIDRDGIARVPVHPT